MTLVDKSNTTSSTLISDTRKPLRRRLLDAVRQQIIPTLEGRNLWRAFLAEVPMQLPKEVTLRHHQGKPLLAKAATSYPASSVSRYWDSAKVHSSHSPYMGFVLAGEIDWRIGITGQIAKRTECTNSDYLVLGIPKSTFFIMPPGVPYSCGQLKHWERQSAEQAAFQVFWMRFIPQGALCHFCWMDANRVVGETDYYIPDPQLLFGANALVDEFRQRGQTTSNISGFLLSFIFYRLMHALEDLQELRPGSAYDITEANPTSSAVELACHYIQSHLQEKINLDDIAAQAFVSAGHLCRIFLEEKKLTVNQYITQHRLERACSLLRGSSLSISAVGQSVGYPDNAYFCRLFVRHFECSPLQFRKNHLREYHQRSSKVRKSQK